MLTAIAVPVFTTQLEKSREATDIANVRSAYAEVISQWLTDQSDAATSISVSAKQTKDNWQMDGSAPTTTIGTNIGSNGQVSVPAKTDKYTVKISTSGVVTVS